MRRDIKEHLEKYVGNGSHIYDQDDWKKNFLFSDEISKVFKKDLKYTEYWRHANASQVMCLNFFYGLIDEKNARLTTFVNSVLEVGGTVTRYVPEYMQEDVKIRVTNFDFYIETDTGAKLYFEIKYTESGFGAKTYSKRRDEICDRYYRPLCLNSFHMKDFKDKKEEFFDKDFQLNRNIAMAKENSYSIFITDENNVSTSKKLDPWRSKKNVITISWQDVVDKVLELHINDDHYKLFKEKYLDY